MSDLVKTLTDGLTVKAREELGGKPKAWSAGGIVVDDKNAAAVRAALAQTAS